MVRQSHSQINQKQTIEIPTFLEEAYLDKTDYVCIKAGRRCFTGDTLVSSAGGYKKIKDIAVGDYVLSYDSTTNQAEYRKVLEVHKFARQKTKPIIQLEYAKRYIEATYDHPFYTENELGEKGYFPAFVIAWRKLEAGDRHKIKVFCERQGEDINHQLQMYWEGSHNEASTRWEWILSDNGTSKREIPHYKTTQRDSKGIHTEPSGQTSDKPQELYQNGQSCIELGMGNIQREYTSLRKTGETNKEQWGEVRYAQTKRVSSARDKKATISNNKKSTERNREEIWSGWLDNPVNSSRERVAISSLAERLLTSAKIAKRQETYDLTVELNHNYCVTKDNLLVHNTGKTYNFVIWLIQQADNDPNSPCLWVDTKHSNIDKYIDRYFKPILKKMNLWSLCNWNQQKKILKLHNGSYIDFGSAERPELMEGFGYKYAVVNEAGIVFKKRSIWENTLYPMVKHAKVRFIGTPKGKNHFESLFRQYQSYTFSAYDSPFWTAEEIEQAKLTMTQEAFKQEMLAEFIDGAGAVFRNIKENISGELTEPIEGRRYILASDIAKHQDFTVILVGDSESKQVVYHERFNQIDWGLQKSRIINVYNKYKCSNGIIDATGVGDAVFDDLKNQGLNLEGFKFTATTKQELVSNLSVAMDNQEIHYPAIETLIDELEMYAYEQRSNGTFSYSAPEGFHDDEVMALALLNRLFNTKTMEWASPVFD